MENTRELIEIALGHAARGWFIFPCSREKRPLTPHGFKDATTDSNQITAWFTQYPGALIGIACAKSGFWVLDIDPPTGFVSLDLLVEANSAEKIVPGITQKTPRGGAHYLYNLPQEVHIPNNAGQLMPGLDLRSDGYICTGNGYTWLEGRSPDEHQLTDAPAWLIDCIAALHGQKAPMPLRNSTKTSVVYINISNSDDPDTCLSFKAVLQVHDGNRNVIVSCSQP